MNLRLPSVPPPKYDQQQDRERRNTEYSNWTGAQLVRVGQSGVDVQQLTRQQLEEHDLQLARQQLAELRTALQMTAGQVICDSALQRVYDFLNRELTPTERARVHFTFFDLPQPTRSVRAE